MLLFAMVVGMLSFFLIASEWYVEGLGFLALTIESTIGLPQVYRNYKTGTSGLRLVRGPSYFFSFAFFFVFFFFLCSFPFFLFVFLYFQLSQRFSTFLIVNWLIGDVIKTIYFISLRAPVQFPFCGIIQGMRAC